MIYHHLTCDHGRRKIEADGGMVIPHPQPYLDGISLSWWTDDPGQPAYALGLQSEALLTCDRTEARFLIELPDDDTRIVPWSDWKQEFLLADHNWADRAQRFNAVSALELGRSPRHWFVARVPIRAEFVPWRQVQ